jgi:hypothetical protein
MGYCLNDFHGSAIGTGQFNPLYRLAVNPVEDFLGGLHVPVDCSLYNLIGHQSQFAGWFPLCVNSSPLESHHQSIPHKLVWLAAFAWCFPFSHGLACKTLVANRNCLVVHHCFTGNNSICFRTIGAGWGGV